MLLQAWQLRTCCLVYTTHMDTKEYCKELAAQVSQAEWDALERCDPSLVINSHNRETLLEMHTLAAASDAAGGRARDAQRLAPDAAGGPTRITQRATSDAADGHTFPASVVNLEAADNLARYLQKYLDEYMSDAPEGHKWIILASLYLAFVAHRPLHPIERTGVRVERLDGTTVYRCPLKVAGDNPICDACICLEKKRGGKE